MGDIADYLSLLEAAKELGVSKSRMEQFIRDGRLTVEWIAGRRVVTKEAVTRLKQVPRLPGKPSAKSSIEGKEEGLPVLDGRAWIGVTKTGRFWRVEISESAKHPGYYDLCLWEDEASYVDELRRPCLASKALGVMSRFLLQHSLSVDDFIWKAAPKEELTLLNSRIEEKEKPSSKKPGSQRRKK